MDSDISNRSSDILRNVVMGRVMEDGSWTEVGRFSDVNITFHGEEMPEEFKTRYLNLRNDVFLTAEIEPTIAKRIADEIYKTLLTPFLLQMADQLARTDEICVCYANPDDHPAIEFIRSIYETASLRALNEIVYTKAVKRGTIYLVPVSKVYAEWLCPRLGIKPDTTILDEISAEAQSEPPVRDISWIRKQMKHCKNPMERKALEKELNEAYKEKKRRRRQR